jgi:hypothetical protein
MSEYLEAFRQKIALRSGRFICIKKDLLNYNFIDSKNFISTPTKRNTGFYEYKLPTMKQRGIRQRMLDQEYDYFGPQAQTFNTAFDTFKQRPLKAVRLPIIRRSHVLDQLFHCALGDKHNLVVFYDMSDVANPQMTMLLVESAMPFKIVSKSNISEIDKALKNAPKITLSLVYSCTDTKEAYFVAHKREPTGKDSEADFEHTCFCVRVALEDGSRLAVKACTSFVD